jgi:hypothetical protein
MTKEEKDAILANLLGISDAGFGQDGLANVAFTLLAVIEVLDLDVNKLAAAKDRIIQRMTKQRTLLQEQRAQEGIREAKRQAGIRQAFQEGREYVEAG